ncbi:MAG: 3-hydroxyacyl-CoA dehydrogenase/enoyl-CoA hydratase family protein [Bryobacteraceae bacterium]|nr:3-hydroxyacyl-CoA dehydrogenase/enoyl-CoA hydratase family protein [Bryobacteraceae bacterium]MDW8379173.1 3-hydroxyacyl-CoA dehydrogenase/enoyl-CoA hydratase family protein [Bryobacterales bacterium]
MNNIRRVAVLGAGVMGSRIAAHFANAGIPSLLLDLVIPNQPDRNAAAKKGIESALKQKPGAFFTEAGASLIQPGNFEDDLPKIAEADWVIEAIVEQLEPKRDLWKRVDIYRRPDAILSTNTSGIPLAKICEGFSPTFCRNFFGAHFFNPPRYLHLLELIPGPGTDAQLLDFVAGFCDRRLGKGVVRCKDTPNFIANRLGSFFGCTIGKITLEEGWSVEEVDAITGSLIGLPNSASYRLLDIVGIDVMYMVNRNLYEAVPHDPWRERFLPNSVLQTLVDRGWLGEKTGQGFYKRVGPNKEIHALDLKTFEYRPVAKVSFPSVEAARQVEDLATRLKMLVQGKDRVASFLWKLFSDYVLYSASTALEIADRIVEIDQAMRWGYAHQLGPFELWDALGFRQTAERIESEGRSLPPAVERMLRQGETSFYRPADQNGQPRTEYFDLARLGYAPLAEREGIISLAALKRARGVVKSNPGASLIDLGDGVLCLEFHSKMNALGEDQIGMIYAGIEETTKNFEAMVIANQAPDFSAGANLVLVLLAAQEGEWEELNAAIHRFQQANMAIKYAPKPVVVAPHGRTLGGGCEISLHAVRCQAAAELYMGLVEVGVGVIPAGGGCKELLIRLKNPQKVFELAGMAKVSSSAEDAKNLGLLNKADPITMNYERLVADAKALALSLAPGYAPGLPRADIKVGGESVFATLKLMAWSMRQGNFISDHDLLIAEKLAHVLAGGRLTGEHLVSEQYLLDLEREAFLSLCGTAKTQERMQYMLKTGKPLRN